MLPIAKPPPWMNINTGRAISYELRGTVIFRFRHSVSEIVISGLGRCCWIAENSTSSSLIGWTAEGLEHGVRTIGVLLKE